MKTGTWTDTVICPNDECEAEIEVSFYPGSPGRTYGRPEDCYEASPDEIDAPELCPSCGERITERTLDKWVEKLAGDRKNRADQTLDRWDD